MNKKRHHMKKYCQLYTLYKLSIFIYTFLLICKPANACSVSAEDSTRLAVIKTKIDSLIIREPAYLEEKDISAGEISLHELLRNIAFINGLNITIKGNKDMMVSCNFTKARTDELIYFLCKEYDLGLEVIGNIVSIYPAVDDKATVGPYIAYNKDNCTLALDFINEPLLEIIKRISKESSSNIILPNKLYNTRVSAFVEKLPLEEALKSFAQINNLEIVKEDSLHWTLDENTSRSEISHKISDIKRRTFSTEQLNIDSTGHIMASIPNGNAYDILLEICSKLKIDYFFINTPNFNTSMNVCNADITTFLNTLFTGTEYSYYIENGIYFFGRTQKNGKVISARIHPLKYRAVENVEDIIPDILKEDIHIKTFKELNSLIVCGESSKTARIISFVNEIDKKVPLITIDIIIAESTSNRGADAGINYGKSEEAVSGACIFSPGIDVTLGSAAINSLIDNFNGFGSIKIGKVPDTFYASLKFLETNGTIAVESTPKLSTLNGREAILTSGETQYYKEVNSSYMGTQNPVQSTSYTWKSIDANLTIKITPYVSSDSLITMNIDLSQSEFTSRVEKDSPPGIVVRSFQSIVRVANNEMVLLGGIERMSKEKSSSGLPFISRIPILKWIFGSTKNSKNESRLNVFIKPSLID